MKQKIEKIENIARKTERKIEATPGVELPGSAATARDSVPIRQDKVRGLDGDDWAVVLGDLVEVCRPVPPDAMLKE